MANAVGARLARPPDEACAAPRYWAVARARLRPRIKHMLFVGATMTAVDCLRVLPQIPDDAPFFTWFIPEMWFSETLRAVLIITAITLVQATPIEGWRRMGAIIAAGFAAAILHLAAEGLLAASFGLGYMVHAGLISSLTSYLMYVAWEWSAVTVALALFYATQEREVLLALRARDIELERVERQRAVMESRLAVLRARVEPEFLFGALDEVRGLYRKDRRAADEMVDALIAYLRAALPQMRGEASTVRRETDLAHSYVAVLQVPRGDALSVSEHITDDTEDVLLPPMVLLPLAQAAFACHDADLRRSFSIDAARSGEGVAIIVAIEGGKPP